MDPWALINKVFHPTTMVRTFAMVAPEHAGGIGGRPVRPREAYVQVRMKLMRLQYDGFVTKRFYPVVHSFVDMSRKGAGRLTVPYVAGPGQLAELDTGQQQVIVSKNVDLIGPTPYIGGTVNVALGLCAAEAKDYLDNLVGVMGSISSVIGTNPLTAVLPMIEPLKGAAEAFLGLDGQVQLKLGVTNGFAEAPASAPAPDQAAPAPAPAPNLDGSNLFDGIYAVVGVDENQGWGPWLHWENGQLRVEMSGVGVQPVTLDHIVFELTQASEMPDWERMPDLNARAEAVMTIAARDGVDASGYRDAFAALKIAVIESPDLIDSDRVRIVRGVEARAKQLALGTPAPDGALGLQGAGPALARAVRSGPSVEDARLINPDSL